MSTYSLGVFDWAKSSKALISPRKAVPALGSGRRLHRQRRQEEGLAAGYKLDTYKGKSNTGAGLSPVFYTLFEKHKVNVSSERLVGH